MSDGPLDRQIEALRDSLVVLEQQLDATPPEQRSRVAAALAEISATVDELRQTQVQLVRRERLALLGQLAGGVGHELRTPLGAISNAIYYLNMVLDEPDPKVKEMLGVLATGVAESERIINSLLGFARAGPPTGRKVDLRAVGDKALARTTVPENVEVVVHWEQHLPAIQGDADQLTQVFGNIILNGIQAMPEGGQLVVKAKAGGISGRGGDPDGGPAWVAISIADTGVGIPAENLASVFEPLFTTKARGIGLGMALVKMLVEGHRGTVEVESEVGRGSTFTVRLPTSERVSGKPHGY